MLLAAASDLKDAEQFAIKRLRARRLASEAWEERDPSSGALLAKTMPGGISGAETGMNHPRCHPGPVGALNNVLAGESRKPKKSEGVDPFAHHLLAHAGCPKINVLLFSRERHRGERSECIVRQMCADGWRAHLRGVPRTDTRSLVACLAKSEGRKARSFVPSDSSPLIGGDALLSADRWRVSRLTPPRVIWHRRTPGEKSCRRRRRVIASRPRSQSRQPGPLREVRCLTGVAARRDPTTGW